MGGLWEAACVCVDHGNLSGFYVNAFKLESTRRVSECSRNVNCVTKIEEGFAADSIEEGKGDGCDGNCVRGLCGDEPCREPI